MKKLAALFFILSAINVNADMLNLVPGTASRAGVNIAKSASATLAGKTYALTTVGAGLRAKRIIFEIQVYVTQVMAADKAAFDANKSNAKAALEELNKQPYVALRLSFLRDVDATKIASSFQEALVANKVEVKDAEVEAFMKMVQAMGNAQNGGSLNIFIVKNADKLETLALENVSGGGTTSQTRNFTSGFSKKLLSIWFGVPADSGLEKLQGELLAGVK